jgi:hypothetical protein
VVGALGLTAVRLVKADVEGAEGALLDGAAETLRHHRPHLLLEIEDRHTRKYGLAATALFDRLTTGLGYNAHVWSSCWQPVAGIRDDERNYLFRP